MPYNLHLFTSRPFTYHLLFLRNHTRTSQPRQYLLPCLRRSKILRADYINFDQPICRNLTLAQIRLLIARNASSLPGDLLSHYDLSKTTYQSRTMAEPLHIRTEHQPTWRSDSSHSSTSSVAPENVISEHDSSPILVYQWGGDISTTSQHDLRRTLTSGMYNT